MEIDNKSLFERGLKDGLPIALGYFGVSMALGISAKEAGLSIFQGFLTSALVNASAGEHAGFRLIATSASYLELIVVTIIVNARYILMSFSLSQKIHPDTPLVHRGLLSFYLTDEFFGLAIGQLGYVRPFYIYGAIAIAAPSWALGTAVGVAAGNILPASLVDALGVALYGMFLAIIIPPARENRVILSLVLVSFLASLLASYLPITSQLTGGTRIILLTLVIAGLAAYFFPIEEDALDG